MGGLRCRSALIAWIAIVAMLGNLTAVFASPVLAQRGAPDYWLHLLGPLVICSEHGTQIAPPDDGKQPEAPAKHCPICLAAAAFALVVALAAAILFAPLIAGQLFAVHVCAIWADGLRRAGLGSRAPPLPA